MLTNGEKQRGTEADAAFEAPDEQPVKSSEPGFKVDTITEPNGDSGEGHDDGGNDGAETLPIDEPNTPIEITDPKTQLDEFEQASYKKMREEAKDDWYERYEAKDTNDMEAYVHFLETINDKGEKVITKEIQMRPKPEEGQYAGLYRENEEGEDEFYENGSHSWKKLTDVLEGKHKEAYLKAKAEGKDEYEVEEPENGIKFITNLKTGASRTEQIEKTEEQEETEEDSYSYGDGGESLVEPEETVTQAEPLLVLGEIGGRLLKPEAESETEVEASSDILTRITEVATPTPLVATLAATAPSISTFAEPAVPELSAIASVAAVFEHPALVTQTGESAASEASPFGEAPSNEEIGRNTSYFADAETPTSFTADDSAQTTEIKPPDFMSFSEAHPLAFDGSDSEPEPEPAPAPFRPPTPSSMFGEPVEATFEPKPTVGATTSTPELVFGESVSAVAPEIGSEIKETPKTVEASTVSSVETVILEPTTAATEPTAAVAEAPRDITPAPEAPSPDPEPSGGGGISFESKPTEIKTPAQEKTNPVVETADPAVHEAAPAAHEATAPAAERQAPAEHYTAPEAAVVAEADHTVEATAPTAEAPAVLHEGQSVSLHQKTVTAPKPVVAAPIRTEHALAQADQHTETSAEPAAIEQPAETSIVEESSTVVATSSPAQHQTAPAPAIKVQQTTQTPTIQHHEAPVRHSEAPTQRAEAPAKQAEAPAPDAKITTAPAAEVATAPVAETAAVQPVKTTVSRPAVATKPVTATAHPIETQAVDAAPERTTAAPERTAPAVAEKPADVITSAPVVEKTATIYAAETVKEAPPASNTEIVQEQPAVATNRLTVHTAQPITAPATTHTLTESDEGIDIAMTHDESAQRRQTKPAKAAHMTAGQSAAPATTRQTQAPAPAPAPARQASAPERTYTAPIAETIAPILESIAAVMPAAEIAKTNPPEARDNSSARTYETQPVKPTEVAAQADTSARADVARPQAPTYAEPHIQPRQEVLAGAIKEVAPVAKTETTFARPSFNPTATTSDDDLDLDLTISFDSEDRRRPQRAARRTRTATAGGNA